LSREYHAQIATCLEKDPGISSYYLFDVAYHYSAAGKTYASKAMGYCRKTAGAACRLFQYNRAENFIKMAKQGSASLAEPVSFEEDTLKIRLHKSHVMGSDRKTAADEGKKYWQKNKEGDIAVSLMLLIVRACYEAGNLNKQYLQEAVSIAREVFTRAKKPEEKAEAYQFTGLSLEYDTEKEKRKEYLYKAKELIESISNKTPDVQWLQSRIYNSLANELSYTGNDKDKEEAVRFFRESIKIKERKDIFDRCGLARAYGGLGRLYLEWNRNREDILKAKDSFEKDLALSKEINDTRGQVTMYGFLGTCHSELGDMKQAKEDYKKALEMASDEFTITRFFTLLGQNCL
jgi:tetratricopeptide (TPR) repeat protein